ncbi:hypothetical protein NHX12_026630 [Muraenolepis orangiensis]|uniref:Structural maintenance of chromosomes protein 6 n=1 Tax=Muraenolepis orangiensis TaxID=630683 RepID=A0A9Q0EHR8_9TELE|nr:hypothetical protein NHX12_026630 [Muraenolepis orangiensis]
MYPRPEKSNTEQESSVESPLEEEVDQGEDEQEEEENVFQNDDVDQMVLTPENFADKSSLRINLYKDTILRPLEAVMSRLESMALKRPSVPVLLSQADEEEIPEEELPEEESETEDLLRAVCSSRTVAPGFRWRRSRWGSVCPVALQEGSIIQGKRLFCVGFQDKAYVLSSREAYRKFLANPRRYLLPPMPASPCRVSVVGPPLSGKSTLCGLLARHYGARVVDVEALLLQPVQATLEQERLEEMTEDPLRTELCVEVLEKQIKEIEEADADATRKTSWILDNFPDNFSQLASLQQAHPKLLPDLFVCLVDSTDERSTLLKRMYEMDRESVDKAVKKRLEAERTGRKEAEQGVAVGDESQTQLKTMEEEADYTAPTEQRALGYPDGPEMDGHRLRIEGFSGEWNRMEPALTSRWALLDIGKPFQHARWEVSDVDLQEDKEDAEALQELVAEKANNEEEEEREEEDTTSNKLFGDTLHFCPVALKDHGVLWPGKDEVAAKYRDKTYYFSSTEALKRFLHQPLEFVATTGPLKPPALRVLMLGPRGSGKTTHGRWLAQQLGIFHIQFRERLQELILAKTGSQVAALSEEEAAVKAYLSNGVPLPPEILDTMLALYWEQEPFRSTGFLLEGFPQSAEEVGHLAGRGLFPDVAVVMVADVSAVVKHLLPPRLRVWKERRDRRRARARLATDLRRKLQELLTEHSIPSLSVDASRKPRIVRCLLLQKIQPLLANRESLFQRCQPLGHSLARKLLYTSYKFHSAFGCLDPVKFIYFFASKETRHTFMRNPIKYLRQSKPSPSRHVTVAVIGPPKSGKTTVAQMFVREQGLARLSVGEAVRTVLSTQGHTELASQMRECLSSGLVVPDELAVRCLEVALMSLACSARGYVLDGFPVTLKQTALMEARSIIPIVVLELELDTVEVLKRGLVDQTKSKPHPMPDSSEILHIRNSHYKREAVELRRHFRQQYRNWVQLDGSRSKWWLCVHALEEISLAMNCVHGYLERSHDGRAACIDRLCVTPKEMGSRLGEFGLYCPVCLALHCHLVDTSGNASLATAAEYRTRYYKMCCADHLERFLTTPDQFVIPGSPHALPPAHLLPRPLTEGQVKDRFPLQLEMRGFCPVTYLDGKQRLPETYWDQKLPNKLPPICEPLRLTSLPMLGYLQQGAAEAVVKAMTAVGGLKPKYPFLSVKKSALVYMAYYLKAVNPHSSDYVRQKYKKRLVSFEESCELIPYLASTMMRTGTSPSAQPADFEFRLHRLLALREPGTASELRVNAGEEEEGGLVESITLKNFMCHSLLGPFTFGSNVNFVVGNNGSGKSAVLTALIVAMGGTALATNRGSSLKGFVKEGENSAEVSVSLRNMGRDSYKPEDYGQTIIIDVKLTREGIRTYKLKNKSGQIVSTKKEELLAMLDNFNIQVDNPMSILTQEMSKQFLHSKGEAEKYMFFMKATQLEQVKYDFMFIKEAKEHTEEKVTQIAECLKELKRTFLEKEDRFKSLSSLDDMQAKLEELQKQMAWSLVSEIERELLPVRQKLKMDTLSTAKFDSKVEEEKEKVSNAEQKYKQIHDQLNSITVRIQELQPQCIELKAEVQKQDGLLKAKEVTNHRCKTSLRDLETDRIQLCSKIDELKLSISQTTGAESQVKERRVQQLQAELEDLSHQDATLGQQIDQYQQATSRANDELGKLRNEQGGIQRAIDASRRNLQTMEASSSNRLRRFGEHMPALLNAIQETYQAGRFKERPRGPLGYCIGIKDTQMALAVEICLKGQLQAFTCDNHADEKVLQGLMAKTFPPGQRPSIITSHFLGRVHDTSRRGVNHPTYQSVLQCLDIEDPVVANCLIDQRGIESVLLFKSRAEARQVMQGASPPKNCMHAFSADGDQVFVNRVWTAEQCRANFLFGDVEEEIRHLQREMENQTAQVGRYQQRKNKVEDDIGKNKDLLKTAHAEQKRTQGKARKLQLELTEMQNVEEPQSEDLKPLEEDLQEIIGKIASKQVQCEEARAQLAQLRASFEEAEQRYKKHKDKISAIAEEADSMKEDLSRCDQEVMKCKHHKKHYEDKRKTHLDNIQALKASLEEQEQELAASVAKATEISQERVEVRRTVKSLESEINRLKFKITAEQDQQGNREEIVKQYKEAYENYNNMTQQMKGLSCFLRLLGQIITDRLGSFTRLRKLTSARCKYYFDTLLSQRGYTGSLTFDHNHGTLSISVQPGEGDKADLSDMRSLSGGERSFSTVCFVLSLWAITEAPFRCLDEFDVFMDMVNRRISMDMMLKIAKAQRFRQFIFLTPQSMRTAASCGVRAAASYQRQVDWTADPGSPAPSEGPREDTSRQAHFAFLPERYEPLVDDEAEQEAKDARKQQKKLKYKRVKKRVGKAWRGSLKCLILGLQSFTLPFTTPISTVTAYYTSEFQPGRG